MHWLRERARLHRWEEEVLLVAQEMQWSATFFDYQAKKWTEYGNLTMDSNQAGHRAYAARHMVMWYGFAAQARRRFLEAMSQEEVEFIT